MTANSTSPTQRLCYALDLKDDPELIERYRQWHAPGGPPAAVNRSIRAADIRDMDIWLFGPRLFMIMEVGPDFDPSARAARDAADPDVIAWEKMMWGFQQALPWAAPGEKWLPGEQIYALSQQPT